MLLADAGAFDCPSVDAWNETLWDDWVNNASAPALDAMLSLYTDLRAQNWSFAFITGRPESQREKTEQNLAAAGYSDWVTLVLRSVTNSYLGARCGAEIEQNSAPFEISTYSNLGRKLFVS